MHVCECDKCRICRRCGHHLVFNEETVCGFCLGCTDEMLNGYAALETENKKLKKVIAKFKEARERRVRKWRAEGFAGGSAAGFGYEVIGRTPEDMPMIRPVLMGFGRRGKKDERVS